MALGSALATTALKAGGSLLASRLGGNRNTRVRTPQVNTALPGLSAGGLTAVAAPNQVSVGSSNERAALVSNLSSVFRNQAGLLGDLRGRVAPGVSDLRASRLQSVEDARNRAIGNLRENLQRRRVLGSSFGQDALTRGEAEFARERDRVEAESFLQELDLTQQLLARETQARSNAFNVKLSELNLQADLAAKLQTTATNVLNRNAQLQAQLSLQGEQFNATSAQKESEGFGSLFGNAVSGIFAN